MMRRIVFFVLFLITLVSCGQESVESGKHLFEFNVESVELNDEGGYIEVGYKLSETSSNFIPKAVCSAEWIVDFDNSTKGKLGFRVLMNETTEERTATITLRHIDFEESPVLLVKQSGLGGDKLSIEIVSTDYAECKAKITPANDTLTYVVMMAEKSYFTTAGITDAETLVQMDLSRYYSYLNGDDTIEEFLSLSKTAQRGEQIKQWQDLSPAKEYVIYAYGIYVKGDIYERVTPIYHATIEKRMPQRTAESFNVTITAEGPEVAFSVVPNSWDGYFVVQLVEDSEEGYIEQGLPFTAENEEQVAEAFFYISDHIYYFEDKTAEEVMQQLGYRGNASFSKTLNANHRYMAIIYAIASDNGNVPMVVSHPQIEYFTTGTVERSDMTFEVEFSNIRPRSVDVKIIPSKDETYTAVMMYAKNLPEGDKQEQLDYVMSKYSPFELSGIYSEHIDQLPPETEFVIAVCGYYAGAATTDLYVYRFATAKDAEGHNEIINVKFSAFDLEEVASLEPYYSSMMGYADYFLSMEVETLTPAPALHFELYAKSQYDSYTHKDIRESLLEYAYTSSPDWALCSYGNEYILCGLAEDENGYVGEMFVSEVISFTKDETSDAAIFVELYKEYVEPRAAAKSMIFRD